MDYIKEFSEIFEHEPATYKVEIAYTRNNNTFGPYLVLKVGKDDWRGYVAMLDFLTSVCEIILHDDELVDAIKSGKIKFSLNRDKIHPIICLSVHISIS